jgi:hypothetical protein
MEPHSQQVFHPHLLPPVDHVLVEEETRSQLLHRLQGTHCHSHLPHPLSPSSWGSILTHWLHRALPCSQSACFGICVEHLHRFPQRYLTEQQNSDVFILGDIAIIGCFRGAVSEIESLPEWGAGYWELVLRQSKSLAKKGRQDVESSSKP